MTLPSPLDPTDAFTELGRIRLGDTDIGGVLTRIAELATATLPGAADASVTLIRDGRARTAAYTGDLALQIDKAQYGRSAGPCMDAAAGRVTMSVTDLATDARWPDWAARAVQAGACSALSVGLPVQETVTGALNVYAVIPHAFDDDAVVLAQTFAGYAAVALANAHLYDTTATLAQQMTAAMESRAVIEQAKGIVMGERGCPPDEAFKLLSRVSQQSNRKLRDVAVALVAEAQRPLPS